MTTASSLRPRRSLALATAALSAIALSGCGLNSPTTTLLSYAPADGVQVDGEVMDIRDLLVVSHGSGAPAVVSGSVVNQSAEPITVTVSANGEALSPEIEVAPMSTVRLDGRAPDGTEGERLVLPALDSAAGQSVEVRVSSGSETLTANAPVLLPHGPYEQFADDAGGTVAPHPTSEDGH